MKLELAQTVQKLMNQYDSAKNQLVNGCYLGYAENSEEAIKILQEKMLSILEELSEL